MDEEKELKTRKTKLTTNRNYLKTLDRISLWLRRDGELTKDKLTERAERDGESVNGWIVKACLERMERETESR